MTVWKSAADELVVGTAARLAVLEWPISESDFPAQADEMGWDAVVPGLLAFHSGLGVTPDLAMATKVKGEIREVIVNLVDHSDQASAARIAFLVELFTCYASALTKEFGEADASRTDTSMNELTWMLEAGGALSLNRTDSMVSIRVDSPRQVHVRGVIRRTEAAES